MEETERKLEQKTWNENLQSISLFRQKTLKSLIDKIKTLNSLQIPQCTCGAGVGNNDKYQKDIVPKVLQEWANATDKVNNIMHQIQLKVEND